MVAKVLPAFVLTLALHVVPAAAEQPSYTIEDVKACSADAIRFCNDRLTDLNAVEVCMKANYERLRPSCKLRFGRAQ